MVLKNPRDEHIEGNGGCKELTTDEMPDAKKSLMAFVDEITARTGKRPNTVVAFSKAT